MERKMAAIIDRETQLPAIRSAAEKALAALETCKKEKETGYDDRGMRCWHWEYSFDEAKVSAALTDLRNALNGQTKTK